MYASYLSSIEITSKLDNFLTIPLRITRLVVEFSAVLLSEVITDLSLAALESGIIARRWWEARGKDQAVTLGWDLLRVSALLVLLLACLICVVGFGLRSAWAWLNRVTDDGLGLYGPSPMLAEWMRQLEFSPSSVSVRKPLVLDVSPLDLPGNDLIIWAKDRWPQLAQVNKS